MGRLILRYTEFVCRYPRAFLSLIALLTLGFLATFPHLKIISDVNTFRDPEFAEPYDELKARYHEYPLQFLIFEGQNEKGVLNPGLLRHQYQVLQEIRRRLPIRTYSLAEAVDSELKRYAGGEGILGRDDFDAVGSAFWSLYKKAPVELERIGRHAVTDDAVLDILRRVHGAEGIFSMLWMGTMGGLGELSLEGDQGTQVKFNEPYIRATKAILELKEDVPLEKRREIFAKARAISESMPHPDLKMMSFSIDLMGVDIDAKVLQNLWLMMLLTGAFILIFLVLLFNRPTYIAVPLLVVGISAVWIMGTASLFGLPITFVHLAAIPIILGTGVDDSILFTERLVEEMKKKGAGPIASLFSTMRAIWLALFLTTFTTFVAFLANAATTSLPPLISFNLLIAAGMIYVFFITITLVSAVYTLFPDRSGRRPYLTEEWGQTRLLHLWQWVKRRSKGIVGFSSLILGASIGFAFLIRADYAPTDYVSPTMPSHRAVSFEDENFVQHRPMYVELKGEAVNDWTLFLKMEFLKNRLAQIPLVEKFLGVANAEMIHDVLRMKRIPPSYRTDYSAEIDALFKDATLADPVTGLTFQEKTDRLISRKGNRVDGILLKFWYDASDSQKTKQVYHAVWNQLRDLELDRVAGVRPLVTGEYVVMTLGLDRFIRNMIYSFVPVTLITILLLWVTWRNFKAAALSMVPIFISVAILLGAMGALHIKLTALNALISSIIVGLGVDYPIHLIERFREEMKHHEPDEALERVFTQMGPTIFGCCLITALGFFVISTSLIPITRDFALLSSAGLILVLLASLIIMPIPMRRWGKKLLEV